MFDYKCIENIPFKICGNIAVLADLNLPNGQPPEAGWPLMIFYHGGGWTIGDKTIWGVARRVRTLMLEQGIACASVGYRHYGFGWSMPAPAADAADAVRYFAANGGKYGVDGSRIVVSGHSAGAHLATLTALTRGSFTDQWSDTSVPCEPLGAIGVSTPTTVDFGAYYGRVTDNTRQIQKNLLGEHVDDAEYAALTSPVTYVQRETGARVPILLICGELDDLTPIAMSRDMVREAETHGYPIRLHAVPATGHGYRTPDNKARVPEAAIAADEAVAFAKSLLYR